MYIGDLVCVCIHIVCLVCIWILGECVYCVCMFGVRMHDVFILRTLGVCRVYFNNFLKFILYYRKIYFLLFTIFEYIEISKHRFIY